MARRLIVEIVGDSSSLQRSFRSASTSARHFNSDMDRTIRGVVAGSGAFRGLGRSIAFASASFIGGAGLISGIRGVIKASEHSQAVLSQTKAAVQAAGLSWAQYGKALQETALRQSQLTAFSDEELLQSFSLLVRRTGDVRKAMRLTALAADVARGRNIGLTQATMLVVRASIGAAGALRRVGIDAAKGASATQLLQLLQRKYAGAAAAYARTAAGAQDRFRNALDNVKEALGRGLLPALTRVLEKSADWLDKTKNQEKIVRDVTGAIKTFVSALRALYTLLTPIFHAAGAVARAIGGWGDAIKTALIAFAAFKIRAAGAAVAAYVANAVAARGTAAAWRAALASTGWGLLVVAASLAAEKIMTKWDTVKFYFKNFWLEFELRANQAVLFVLNVFSKIASHLKIFIPGLGTKNLIPGSDKLKNAADFFAGNVRIITQQQKRLTDSYVTSQHKIARAKRVAGNLGDMGKLPDLSAGPLPKFATATATPKKTWLDKFDDVLRRFQLLLSRAQLTKSLQDDLAVLRQMEASIRAQLALHKGNIDLQEKLVEVLSQEKDLEQQIAAARQEAIKARQFRALGLTATGDDPIPGIKALRRMLAHFQDAVTGTFLDTKKTQSIISRIRKVLSGGLGAVGREVRSKIAQILDDLDQQLKQHAGDQTKFHKANASKLLAGLGLSPDQLRAVRQRLAIIGPGGTVPGAMSPAYAMAINTVNVYGVRDPRQFEDYLHRRARSRPSRRRGG